MLPPSWRDGLDSQYSTFARCLCNSLVSHTGDAVGSFTSCRPASSFPDRLIVGQEFMLDLRLGGRHGKIFVLLKYLLSSAFRVS